MGTPVSTFLIIFLPIKPPAWPPAFTRSLHLFQWRLVRQTFGYFWVTFSLLIDFLLPIKILDCLIHLTAHFPLDVTERLVIFLLETDLKFITSCNSYVIWLLWINHYQPEPSFINHSSYYIPCFLQKNFGRDEHWVKVITLQWSQSLCQCPSLLVKFIHAITRHKLLGL